MSADEVMEVTSARLKRRREEAQQLAAFLWKHGELVSYSVWDAKNYPGKEEAFPGLFKAKDNKTPWQVIKARMGSYAKAKRQVRKNDGGRA